MSHRITSECIGCGACAEVCPVDAISESGEIYKIDPEICCDCVGYSDDFLCVTACQVEGAIVPA